MAQILFFGGSNVQGVGDPEGGWADRFKRELHEAAYLRREGRAHNVFNLGVQGNNSIDVFERMQYEIMVRKESDQEAMLVISVGTNDSRAIDSPSNYVSAPEEFRANLYNIVSLARSYSSRVLLVGLTPTDDLKTQSRINNTYFSQERVQLFDMEITRVAREKHLSKVELFGPMLAQDWRAMLFEDGLHLNGDGHNYVYQQVRRPLLDLLD